MNDKLKHLIAGFVVAVPFTLVFGIGSGILASVVIGIGKEIYDYFHPESHTADPVDAVATILGGILGAVISKGIM